MVQIGLKELIWSISPLTIFKTSSSQFHPVYMRDRFSKYLIFQRVDVKMSIDDFPFRCSFVYARKKSVRSMCAFCINISIVLFADWIFLQAHVFRTSIGKKMKYANIWKFVYWQMTGWRERKVDRIFSLWLFLPPFHFQKWFEATFMPFRAMFSVLTTMEVRGYPRCAK